MDDDFLAKEAEPVAEKLAAHLKATHAKVFKSESAWEGVRYRTSFHVVEAQVTLLYEVQEKPHLGGQFRNFAQWLAAQRHSAELRVVVAHEAQTAASLLSEFRKNGVGLLILKDDNTFEETFSPRNPALVVTPDPTLRCGLLAGEVNKHVEKFNGGQRKDALRDMCELVESEIGKTLVKAVRKGWCLIPEAAIKGKDLSDQINTLASTTVAAPGRNPVFDDKFKTDLHSFRGARNLIDHPAKTKRDDAKRQRQFSERMMMGPRLVAELQTLKRKIC